MFKKYGYLTLIIIFILLLFPLQAGPAIELKPWTKSAAKLPDSFFTTKAAKKIGNNCIYVQSEYGGFPKNVFIPELNKYEKNKLDKRKIKRRVYYSTLDNDATTTEITYLSRLYNATEQTKYKKSALKGIDFIFESQFPNGCFAQAYLAKGSYQGQISFNDDSTINVMNLLKKISQKQKPFEYINDTIANKAKYAYENGINCILKTQIPQNGCPSAWAQHYDKETLQVCQGRKFEPAAIVGGKESANIVLFLMDIEKPSQEIIKSVDDAVAWFEKSKIKNVKIKYFLNDGNNPDIVLEKCTDCPPIWARFYDIKTNQPIFGSKDEKIHSDIRELKRFERLGYDWYSTKPAKVLKKYPEWKKKNSK